MSGHSVRVNRMINYKKFLTEHDVGPLETWNSFEFSHKVPSSTEERKRQIEFLRKVLPKGHGLYVYFTKDGECLYVGKAAPLFNRLKSHYQEAFRKVPGDTKTNKWHRFFSSNLGQLVIYWKEVAEETDRRIFELALTAVLKPEFKNFR